MHKVTFTSDTGIEVSFDQDALCCIAQIPFEFTGQNQVRLDREIRVLGTGFYFCGDDTVITAKHVLTDSDPDYGMYAVLNLSGNGDTGLAGKLAMIEEVRTAGPADFAVIIVAKGQSPAMEPFLLGNHEQCKGGVFAIGYSPSSSQVTLNGWKAKIVVNFCKDIDIEEWARAKQPVEFMVTYDAPFVEPGNSGGPILNKDGRVIGVISRRSSGWTASSEATHTKGIGKATSLRPFIDSSSQMARIKNICPELLAWFTGEVPTMDHIKAAFEKLTPAQIAQMEAYLISFVPEDRRGDA